MLNSMHERILKLVLAMSRDFASMYAGEIPAGTPVEANVGNELTETPPKQLRADGVITIGNPPYLGIIVEAQTSMSGRYYEDKCYTWPHYAIGLRTELRCPTITLVVTTDARIEARARQPIPLGLGNTWQAIVIGPSDMPATVSREFAKAHPGLALLTVLVRGKTYSTIQQPREVLHGVLESKIGRLLENDERKAYYDLV